MLDVWPCISPAVSLSCSSIADVECAPSVWTDVVELYDHEYRRRES